MFLDIIKLNRGVGLRRYLSPTYNAVLSSLPRQLNNHSHMVRLTLATYMKAGWVTSHKWPLWISNSELTLVLNDSVGTPAVHDTASDTALEN